MWSGDTWVMVLEGFRATVEASPSPTQGSFDIEAAAPDWKGDAGRGHLRFLQCPDRLDAVECSFDIRRVEVVSARGMSPDEFLEHEDGRVILNQGRHERRDDCSERMGESGEDFQFTNRLGVRRGVVDDLDDVIRPTDLHAIETAGGGPCVMERAQRSSAREPRGEKRLLEQSFVVACVDGIGCSSGGRRYDAKRSVDDAPYAPFLANGCTDKSMPEKAI